MKKIFLALAAFVAFSGAAQVLNVTSVDKVNIPANPEATVVGISPQGNYLLLSTASNQGLTKFDLTTQEAKTLSTARGAGFDVKISQDGQTVVYREDSFTKDHLRKVSLNAISLENGAVKNLVAPTRDLQGVAVEGATAAVVNKGKFSTKALGATKAQSTEPVLSINNRHLMITQNGKTKEISPNGKNFSYIWPSVSPDGTKALYYVCGVGAFVCDLNGKNVKELGQIRAPKWYDNETIVGMQDEDNGEFTTASKIVASNLNGEIQTLTDGTTIAMYPFASAATGKIAFSTPTGEAYIINVTK